MFSMLKHILLPNIRNVNLRQGLILWYDLRKGKGREVCYMECYEPVEGRFIYSCSQVGEGLSGRGG
jgi:hypothetical protein